MLLFYLFLFSAASKHLLPVAIAPPMPEMPSLPTNLPDFSPKEAGWLQPPGSTAGFGVQFCSSGTITPLSLVLLSS